VRGRALANLSRARKPTPAQDTNEHIGWLLASLGGMRRLEALGIDCPKDGAGLHFLGLAAAGLSQNLRSLDITCHVPPDGGGEEEEPPFANLSVLGGLAPSLQALILRDVPLKPPRASAHQD
jgi:hypothetical protein